MELVFRKADISDAEAIGKVHYQGWMETYTGLIDPDYLAGRSPEQSAEAARKSQCRNRIVAAVDGTIVGFCGYGAPRDAGIPEGWGEIQGIYILRNYQGLGLGRGLMERAAAELKALGYDAAFLWVLDSNTHAIGFYEKLGWQFTGAEKTAVLGTPVTEKQYWISL